MNTKSLLKRVPGLVPLCRLFFRSAHAPDFPHHSPYLSYPHGELESLSNVELLSLMRHEAHRIEKAVYNNILEAKKAIYQARWERLGRIYQILETRGYPTNEPTIVWSKKIYNAFDTLEADFVQRNGRPAAEFDPSAAMPFIEFLRARRSVRVWAEEQPDPSVLEEIACHMIDAARWAPNSGNRQPWRFIILKSQEEKDLLRKIKEEHCTSAPLLIFVGMDTRVYGALGKFERSVFTDAGAAIMQMVLIAHRCGLGTCWNHFADDLINSREINQEIYANFAEVLNIPEHIAPIAIVAVGVPKFIPPEPARTTIENLVISSGNHRTCSL